MEENGRLLKMIKPTDDALTLSDLEDVDVDAMDETELRALLPLLEKLYEKVSGEEPEEQEKVHLFEVELPEESLEKRDVSLFDAAYDAIEKQETEAFEEWKLELETIDDLMDDIQDQLDDLENE